MVHYRNRGYKRRDGGWSRSVGRQPPDVVQQNYITCPHFAQCNNYNLVSFSKWIVGFRISTWVEEEGLSEKRIKMRSFEWDNIQGRSRLVARKKIDYKLKVVGNGRQRWAEKFWCLYSDRGLFDFRWSTHKFQTRCRLVASSLAQVSIREVLGNWKPLYTHRQKFTRKVCTHSAA